jgi:hypothetical protein
MAGNDARRELKTGAMLQREAANLERGGAAVAGLLLIGRRVL